MAEHPNVAVVRSLYTAFGTGDMEAMSQILSPDIVWNTPGQSQVSGQHQGQDAVFKVFAVCGDLSEGTLNVELETIRPVGDNTVITTHRVTAQRGDGAKLDIRETETVTLENGRITRVDESVDDQAASDAFFR